jgi:WD40 repeat protein
LAVLGETNTGPVAFSPDGKTLAVVTIETGKDASGETTEHAVALWDVPTGRPLGKLKGHTASITSLAFTPDGRTLATGSYDDTVRLWQPDTQQDMGARSVGSTVTSLAFSRDGRALAIGVFDRTARLWRAAGD